MKKLLFMCLMALAFCSVDAKAQGLGGLLKKVKKGVESITGTTSTETATTSSSAAQQGSAAAGVETPVEGGGTVINPLPKIVDIQLEGAYGKTTSTNYGEVSLVFKVKMIANLTSIKFGSNTEYPGLMVDQDGNAYKVKNNGWYPYSVTEGVYMKISLSASATFVDVKRTAKTIQRLQLGVSTSYNDTGLVILKDVPIQWDVQKD